MAFTYGSVTNCKVVNGTTRTEYQCRLGYQVNSQSIENNTSNITLRLEVRSISSSYGTYGYNQTTTIDGTSLSAAKFDMRSTNTWQVFGSRTINVTHNSDGTYSSSKSGSFTTTCTSSNGGNYALKSGSASVTVKPATIPRATTPTLSSTEYEMGTTITINTPRLNDSFTHELYFQVGTSAKTLIADDVETSYDWSKNLYLINWITNLPYGTITIYCQTYNGDTYIGEKSVTFTGLVPDTVVPIIDTFTISEYVEEVSEKVGVYLKGKSQLNISSSASGNYASTITSYKIEANGETFNTASATTNVLKESGEQIVKLTVTDSRGRIATDEITINVIDYFLPKASGLSVYRCDSNGTLQDDGVYVKAYINYEIAPIENLNSKKATIQYLDSNGTWQTVATFTDSYTASSRNHVITNTEFNIDNTYKFKLVVEDSFTSDEWNALPLPTSYTLMNYHKSGKSIGFGKVATREEGFQFGDFMYDQWDTVITNGLAVYGGDPDTTMESLIMTSTNSPNGEAMYFFTFFSSNKSESQNCGQIAIPYYYNGTQAIYWRYRFAGWSEWKRATFDVKNSWSSSEEATYSCSYLNKSIITAFLKAGAYTSGVYSTIDNYTKTGNKLSISGNSIVIGSGVSKVKISSNFNIQLASASGCHLTTYIKKNGETIMRSYEYTTIPQWSYMCCVTPSFIQDVNEGDEITFECYSGVGGDIHNNEYGKSYITVEVIE